MPRKITKSEMPHTVHAKLITAYTKVSVSLFKQLSSDIKSDIKKLLKTEKLLKSEKLKSGWTGDVPKLNSNLEAKIESVFERYLNALRYFMLGDYAGKEAKAAAESLGLLKKFMPGTSYGIYLQAIDTQRDYFKQIFEKPAPNIPKDILKETFDNIQRKTDRILNESLEKYKNQLIDTVELALEAKNIENVGKARQDKKIDEKLKPSDLFDDIDDVNDKAAESWETNTETIYNMSSSVGTHQAVTEIFGADDDSVKAALLNMQDERCCDKCEEFARNSDGTLKLHKLSDFKPSGYNYKRKMADWCLCIPGIHPRCRCSIIYVPPGAKISNDGILSF